MTSHKRLEVDVEKYMRTFADREPGWKAAYESELLLEKRRALKSIGLPKVALECCDGDLQNTLALNYLAKPFKLLVLSGRSGTGKTVAAVSWIKLYVEDNANWSEPGAAVMPKGRLPVWVTAARLSRWEHYERESMAKLMFAPRLVIDDLGAEFLDKSGYYTSLLDEVINERCSNHRATILTTNLDADQFAKRYDERIMSRIRGHGAFFGCGARDMRMKGAA